MLTAGYQGGGASGVIFTGNVKEWRKGRETPVDTYLDVIAADGDRAYNYAVVNKTLEAGHTNRDALNVITQSLAEHGVDVGHIADLGQTVFPRARVMFGMARDYLRTLCRSTNTLWTIQNEKLQIVEEKRALPGSAYVLNSETGLIGMPEQTMGGIQARCLLNPDIQVSGQVQIDQSSVSKAMMSSIDINQDVDRYFLPGIAADGMYKVLYMSMIGDTRGPQWYCDLTLQSLNPNDSAVFGPLTNGLTNAP
ncbi:hypothetical protein FHS81_003582 [Pseudochelatococcus contaminans]|uniref:Uncharacterized protein n=1 Tax=Pseudochelatococcus contaminans TaxID=1538103 RepID=A0A7W5Z7A7_9HYPH|nr:hypothetical protein [Pseudochelatococcus contaminans]MBB3811467.1 hypothetical protein [Pseudochelatococcus contaminans]